MNNIYQTGDLIKPLVIYTDLYDLEFPETLTSTLSDYQEITLDQTILDLVSSPPDPYVKFSNLSVLWLLLKTIEIEIFQFNGFE